MELQTFRVGDLVMVRPTIRDGYCVEFVSVSRGMLQYRGKAARIVYKMSNGIEIYRIDIDEGQYWWHGAFLQYAEFEQTNKFERYCVGDVVKIVDEPAEETWFNPATMNHWLGKTMTIRDISWDQFGEIPEYKMHEDREETFGDGWSWHFNDIERIVERPAVIKEFKADDLF